MKKIYIWGAGYYLQQIINEIDTSEVNILGIIDNDRKKQGRVLLNNIPVISPLSIAGKDFDYLVISVRKYKPIVAECVKSGISSGKIICYWKAENDNLIFKNRAERIEELTEENKILQCRLDSAPYEWREELSPKIIGGTTLLKKIIRDRSSLCRLGDGEFNIIQKKKCSWFQDADDALGERLRQVLDSEDSRINIAIAQNFIGFEKYKEEAADAIRKYMFGDKRKFILKLMNKNRIYYDAYVTRPYIIYRDRRNADEIFTLFRELWKDRDVMIVEGEFVRMGIGNDLLHQARSVARILCPAKNAWDKYEEILETVLENVSKETLICIALGPCATVLAYDLAKEGYQALDIGQLDNEYEWYLRGVRQRIVLPGKMVAEIAKEQTFFLDDETEYANQIIEKII